MASRQRTRAANKDRTSNQLTNLGLFDIPDLDAMDNGDESDVDESALESELEAILSGKFATKPPKPKKKAAPVLDIEIMAAECLKDIADDDDVDEDTLLSDPDLLKELNSLSCESSAEEKEIAPKRPSIAEESMPGVPSIRLSESSIIVLLGERLKLYHEAAAVAKLANDSSKCRRYDRAVKTLEELLKSAKLGRHINEEDIPPVVSISKIKPTSPTEPTSTAQESNPEALSPLHIRNNVPTDNLIDIGSDTTEPQKEGMAVSPKEEELNNTLVLRRDAYKVAALQAKRAGDKATALNYMKIAKSFDAVIEASKRGEPINFSDIPPPPPVSNQGTVPFVAEDPKKENDVTQTSSMEAAALSAASEPEDPSLFAAPPAPTSCLEALEQRLEKYTSTKAAAEADGNTSKVRRLDRIIKSYQKAIKDYKAGCNVDFEELPTPPGFAPIPVPEENQKPAVSSSPVPDKSKTLNKPDAIEVPAMPPRRPAPEVPAKATQPQKPKIQRNNTSTIDKQLEFLLERQKLFRQAALTSKKNGDIEQAKNYLRLSKGFDSMIEATRCGLPIDASSIPTPPQFESDFVVVDISECVEDDGSSELLETLENDLVKQIEVCNRNKEHFLKLGDVSSASKFEKLGLESKKDLSVIRHLKKTGQALPKFHYETRLFSVVQCHTDLADNELEVTVERGINLPGKPDDLDSYVKMDFPIPSDAPQKAKTHTIRDTNNPIFQEEFKFEINRKSRAQLRQFKRGTVKLEVWSKGGFLRSDSLLGTVYVKLVDLESKCSIHDSFDLMDGRKACGGKLEVKVRIRHPLLAKQIEEVKERWLVIGS